MKLRQAILVCLILFLCSIAAQATQIQIQSQVVSNWNDRRTSASNPPHVRIYVSEAFFDNSTPPILIPASGTNGGLYQDITCSQVGTTVTIPAFTIASTMDASSLTRNAKYTFYWYTASGAQLSPIPIIQNIMVPGSIVSTSGCTPIGTCATLNDLVLYNTPSPALPPDIYPTQAQVTAQIISNLSLAAGAPASAPYIVKVPTAGIANAQALSLLATGIMKSTTGTGTVSIAVAGTDYQAPISVTTPLTFTNNTVAIPVATSLQNGYLSSTDWATFNGKQAALGFTPENIANINVTYAGLSSGKVALSQISEVLALGDLTDATGALGTGTVVPKGTFSGITSGQAIIWNGTNFVPGTIATVSSVGLSSDATWFTVGSSPITTSGTITLNLTSGLTANRVLATPDSSTGAVSLRALVNNDLPTVAVAKGGTALTALPSANQVLGVNTGGTAYEGKTITAGANITVTPAAGSITIAAAGLSAHNILSVSHGDTTPATAIRGDLMTAQGSGTPTWARLALGTSSQVLISNGTDVVWGQVSLTAAVSGILPAANGGTGFSGAAAANGTVPIGNGSGFTLATLTAGSNITITNSAGGIQIDASGTLGTNWDSLTSPASANLALSMAAHTTTFTWGNTTGGGVDLFVLRDSASNTGTGHVVVINTASSSAAKPILIAASGTTNGVEMSTAGILAPIGTGGITANALNGVSANGIQVRTSAGTFTSRSIVDAAGLTWTNGDGVSGNMSAVWNPTTFVGNVSLWDASQTSRTLTANLSGANDPVITFGNLVVNISTGSLQQGGVNVVLETRTLTGGTGIQAIGDLSVNRTITLDQTFSPTWTGVHIFTPAARSSGIAAYLTINAPTDTGLTADTEAIGVLFNSATRTHADGTTQTNQREYVLEAPTYAAAGTSVITNAATLAIEGAPIAGTNITLTNKYALWVQGGATQFDGRVYINPTPVFDLASNVLGVDVLMAHASTITVPASSAYSHLRMSRTSGQPNEFSIGSGGVASSLSIFSRSVAGSNSASAGYGLIVQSDNAGPGVVKALHLQAVGITGSTGVLTGASFDVIPVTGQGSTFVIQVATSGITNVSRGIIFTTNNSTNFDYGIDFLGFGSSPGFNSAAIRLPNNIYISARNAANSADVALIKVNAAGEGEVGAPLIAQFANPYYQVGTTATGWLFQKVDSDDRLRFFKQGTGEFLAITSSGRVDLVDTTNAAITFPEISTTPANPTSGTEARVYFKTDKIVFVYNDGGTVRYKYLDMTGTGVTWVHTTTAP